MLLEVHASKDLVRSIEMTLPTGKDRIQVVVCEHDPKFCGNCRMFGHKTATYISKNQAVKQSQAVETNTKQTSTQDNGQLTGDHPVQSTTAETDWTE